MVRCCVCLSLAIVVAASSRVQAQFKDETTKDRQRIAELIKKLGSNQFIDRAAARRELEAAGELALEALHKAADTQDLEVSRRARQIILAIDKALFFQVRVFQGHLNSPWITRLAVTPDGRQMLSAAPDGLRLWDIGTGKLVLIFGEINHAPAEWSVAMSRDGRQAITGLNGGAVQLWDLKTGKLAQGFVGHAGDVSGVALFPDGRRAASGSLDETIRIWDVRTGQQVRQLSAGAKVRCLALSPDGKQLAAGIFGDGNQPGLVKIWDLKRDRETLALRGHARAITSVAFSADGKSLLSAGLDQTVRLWDLTGGKEQRCFKAHQGRVQWAAFTPDGRRIVSAGDDADPFVRIWDVETGKQIRRSERCPAGIVCAAVLPDGRHAVSSEQDGSLRLWGWK